MGRGPGGSARKKSGLGPAWIHHDPERAGPQPCQRIRTRRRTHGSEQQRTSPALHDDRAGHSIDEGESLTALLGVIIVGFTLVMGWKAFSYVGEQQKMSDAKDVTSTLMLELAGVVIGYYFGRVPADAEQRRPSSRRIAPTPTPNRSAAKPTPWPNRLTMCSRARPSGAAARGVGSRRRRRRRRPDAYPRQAARGGKPGKADRLTRPLRSRRSKRQSMSTWPKVHQSPILAM
ncbi:MAG: hypothetical protein MZV70_44870 [Desulfobacterales bacterium]|nr:hypothetical protein [Desulfobacterales bacterium]